MRRATRQWRRAHTERPSSSIHCLTSPFESGHGPQAGADIGEGGVCPFGRVAGGAWLAPLPAVSPGCFTLPSRKHGGRCDSPSIQRDRSLPLPQTPANRLAHSSPRSFPSLASITSLTSQAMVALRFPLVVAAVSQLAAALTMDSTRHIFSFGDSYTATGYDPSKGLFPQEQPVRVSDPFPTLAGRVRG